MSLLSDLRAQRDAIDETLAGGLAAQELREGYVITPEEQAEFDRLSADAEALDARLAPLEALEARRSAAARANAGIVHVGREPMTYERGNGNNYFSDLALAERNPSEHREAMDRLQRHAAEMAVELPARAARRAEKTERELRSVYGETASFEKRVNPNRTDGQGGYFVPPTWLIDEYITFARAGAPFVNALRNMDLPEGTDSINIPGILSGTATGVQTADAQPVTSTDFTDTYVNAGVKTIAGQQDVALQLIEQSPNKIIDEVILGDLTSDYNRNKDRQALKGTGASGQTLGIRAVTGVNAITYTDASPTVPEMVPALAQSLSQIAQGIFQFNRLLFVMHPRRWFWMTASLDTANRPLIPLANQAALSPLAQAELNAEGIVGTSWQGPQVMIDSNVGTTYGGGTEDEIYAVDTSQTIWFEGSLRTRVLFEVLSGTLQARYQIYNYCAELTRRPTSISVISGTGLAAPSGY